MLRNVETGELRYFHSSFNNNRYFDIPHRIRNVEDLERFIEEIARQDLLRPNDRLMVNAVGCCVKVWRAISGKVEDAISFKAKLYRSWTRFYCFPEFGWYSSVLDIVFWFPGSLVIY
jgi:hypothetical protein